MRDTNQQGPRKVFLAAGIVGTFVIYTLAHNAAGMLAPAKTANGNGTTNTPTDTPSSGTATGPTTGNGQYKNGTYTGPIADAQWGYVQVRVTITGGSMSNVEFLQYPNDRERSIEINSYADPILIQEAIQAQSAQVDFVSGATDSSDAFAQSLQQALSQAQ